MTAQIRAELLKLRSTRTTIALILGLAALILLFTLLTGLLSHPSGLTGKQNQRQLLGLSSLAGVFAALAGVLLVTSEYRYGTIRPTILFNPTRSHVLAAKVVVGMLAGAALWARSAPASARSSTTRSAQSSRSSPGASSSTTSSSASSPPSGGSRQPVPRTRSWASELTTCSHQAPAPAP